MNRPKMSSNTMQMHSYQGIPPTGYQQPNGYQGQFQGNPQPPQHPVTDRLATFRNRHEEAYHQTMQNHHNGSLQSTCMTQQLMQQASDNTAKKQTSRAKNPRKRGNAGSSDQVKRSRITGTSQAPQEKAPNSRMPANQQQMTGNQQLLSNQQQMVSNQAMRVNQRQQQMMTQQQRQLELARQQQLQQQQEMMKRRTPSNGQNNPQMRPSSGQNNQPQGGQMRRPNQVSQAQDVLTIKTSAMMKAQAQNARERQQQQ